MGAARVADVGPHHLTMTAQEAVEIAALIPHARIVPLHFESWTPFSEGRDVIEKVFADARMSDRLVWGKPGSRVNIA
jgi:hypothetical protein